MRALVSGEREAFYSSEIELRERTRYPPFGRLASLVVSAGERSAAESYARALAGAAPPAGEVCVLGPAEAPLAVLRGRHRFRLLVKSPRGFDLSFWLRRWLSAAPRRTGNLKLEVDVDPQSFL
jgi:primosomal protein N' (replication factor Y)